MDCTASSETSGGRPERATAENRTRDIVWGRSGQSAPHPQISIQGIGDIFSDRRSNA
jgi:hypothetical protein